MTTLYIIAQLRIYEAEITRLRNENSELANRALAKPSQPSPDIVEQLREKARWRPHDVHGDLHNAAAEEIDVLRRELTRLRAENSGLANRALAQTSLPEFEDARVQIVYELLCDTKEPPNPEEHWEGWLARRIVSALSSTPSEPAQSPPPIDLHHRNAILESAALVAEQVDNCRPSTYDDGATESGYNQAKQQIADAVRRLKCAALPSGSQAVAQTAPPVAWIALSEETGNTRIWWRDKVRADAWCEKHNVTPIPLYAALPSGSQATPETDDLASLVDGFSKALLAKLRLAHANGRSGWEKDDWENECQKGLLRHIAKGDPRDVAAYCAFMWHHGWIALPSGSQAAGEAKRAHKVMTRGEYDNMVIIGWHEVCRDVDSFGGLGVRFLGTSPVSSTERHPLATKYEEQAAVSSTDGKTT